MHATCYKKHGSLTIMIIKIKARSFYQAVTSFSIWPPKIRRLELSKRMCANGTTGKVAACGGGGVIINS